MQYSLKMNAINNYNIAIFTNEYCKQIIWNIQIETHCNIYKRTLQYMIKHIAIIYIAINIKINIYILRCLAINT